jgi:hypothetical protein
MLMTIKPAAEQVAEFSEALNAFVESFRDQPRVDPVVMSGVCSELALEIRKFGGLRQSAPKITTAQLLRPDSYAFRPALLAFLADWLPRINNVTAAANLEIWASRLG